MTVKLKRNLIRLFLFFTMLAFTLLFLFFAGSAVKKEREAGISHVNRLADGIVNEIQQGTVPTKQNLYYYAEKFRVWICLWDGQEEKAGPEFFRTPVSDLTNQIRAGSGMRTAEETVSSSRRTSRQSRTTHLLTGRNSETYYGLQIHIYGTGTGDHDLIFLYLCTPIRDILWADCRLYPLLWLLIFAVMYGMSRFLIRKALLPVEASIKSQKEFIAAASHELKAPLSVIQANAEAMEPAGDEQRKQTVILEECGRMADLLGSLLTLAATDTGSFRIRQRETDMDTLLIETWEAFLPAFRKKGIFLELDTGEKCFPKVFCDGERIGQVLRILLDNALDHSPAGSSVLLKASLQTARKENFFVCSVIDHGSGIPVEYRERVFERFFCGDASHTDRNHFGLGLSIAKEILERHQVSVALSDTPGGGCTFQFLLPL